MKASDLACAAMLLALLIATTSSASIVYSGDTYSQAGAFASQSSPSDGDYDGGSYSITTTEDGTFSWSYSVSASAWAKIRGTDAGSNYAYGFGGVNVSGVASDYVSASATRSGELGTTTDSDGGSDSGTTTMRAGYGLFFSHGTSASASWDSPDGSSQAASQGNASVSGSMF